MFILSITQLQLSIGWTVGTIRKILEICLGGKVHFSNIIPIPGSMMYLVTRREVVAGIGGVMKWHGNAYKTTCMTYVMWCPW